MKAIPTWFICSEGTNWLDGEYLLDYQDIKQKKYALWNRGQIAVSEIKTIKQAYSILTSEFKNISHLVR
jgi:hypothetical protein